MSDPYDGEDLTNKWRLEQHEEDLEEIRKAKEALERKKARERAEKEDKENDNRTSCAQRHDAIHHPDHYSWRGMECIELIKAFVLRQTNGFWASCEANILKYLYRWVRKNRVQDLQKAREYLDMMIQDVEENGVRENDTGV